MLKPRPSHVFSAVLTVVILGAGAVAVLSSSSPDADPKEVATFDPTAVSEGDDVACAEFDEQAARNRRSAVDDPEFGGMSPDDPALRPHEPGVRGGRVDPAEYIAEAERSPSSYQSPGWPKLAEVSAPLLAPTWLPDELRHLPVFVGSHQDGEGYVLYWGWPAGTGPEYPFRVDVRREKNATSEDDFHGTLPTFEIRGRRGHVNQSFPGNQSVAWSLQSGGYYYGVGLSTPAFDPGTNCRELLAIARSFQPFRPTGGDTPPQGPTGETGPPAPTTTTLAEPTTTLPGGDATTTTSPPAATGP